MTIQLPGRGPRRPDSAPRRRVYPLDSRELTAEQIAVTFAMTSRRPEPFDEIAAQVSSERAGDFNERWVVGYGHASVAEHAVAHLAVENISRLACDALEDNRLASYTEKSSRYQVIDAGDFYIPHELDDHPALALVYEHACRGLFAAYRRLLDGIMAYLRRTLPPFDAEREESYRRRLRRLATDAARSVLPAATLTNVGVTANARTLEYAISKLLSSERDEEWAIGAELQEQGRKIAPTLVKYADYNPYLTERRSPVLAVPTAGDDAAAGAVSATLVDYDRDAVERVAAALLFREGGGYAEAVRRVAAMSPAEKRLTIHAATRNIGPHDSPPREFETASYAFEFVLDYGALREFRRHRMLTGLSQPLTVRHGYNMPPLVDEAGLRPEFEEAMTRSERTFAGISPVAPLAAPYLVTHAHRQRILARVNLRECWHLFRLRTAGNAHRSIREPVKAAMSLAVAKHPELFEMLRLK